MTYESLKRHFKIVFGAENELFIKMLYNYLISDFTTATLMQRKGLVSFSTFVKKMVYFVRQERYGVAKAIYKILNSANRPTLLKTKSEKFTLFDIVNALSQVSQATQWGEELKAIQDAYFNQIVMAQHKKKSSIIEPDFFNKILPFSCIGSEIMIKLFDIKSKIFPKIKNGSIFALPKATGLQESRTFERDMKAKQFFSSL